LAHRDWRSLGLKFDFKQFSRTNQQTNIMNRYIIKSVREMTNFHMWESFHFTQKKIKKRMRPLPYFLIIIFCGMINSLSAQEVSLHFNKSPLKAVMREIQNQTGFSFSINDKNLSTASPVTINTKKQQLKEVLTEIFQKQPLTYKIDGKLIIIIEKTKDNSKPTGKQNPVRGKVVDEAGSPLAGASVRVKDLNIQTSTDENGNFQINNVLEGSTLIITYIGYLTQEVTVKNASKIILSKNESKLDEVQVIAYGTTTRRLNTGSVGSISSADIAKQPVSNPLAALSGRIPGLILTQSTGVPGSSFNIQIRGRNSIAQGSQPLILIDGIPFAAGNEGISTITSALTNGITGTALSPFNSINPSDIESIEILKDADATAIYGSRGANGVILITTRKGKAGKTQINANINQGFTQVGKTMDLMNTEQYLEMRKEAFVNSNITPTVTNAPDILAWDQNRYTDYKKELIGSKGKLTNAQFSLSGGSSQIQYLVAGSFYRETSVFPNALPNTRGSVNTNLNHNSNDNRFKINLSTSFTSSENKTASTDLTYYTFLAPNTPTFFTNEGNLKWVENGAQYENPYRYLFERYNAKTNNLVSSLNISYRIINGLSFKIAMGYNQLNGNEMRLTPKTSLSPNQVQISSSQFGTNEFNSWNIEPQFQYVRKLWKGNLDILTGATFHQKNNTGNYTAVSGFTTDALLESISAASTITAATNYKTQYRYQALFGRINYNLQNKYIVNLTARRDGSSRFGSGKQFANFGAAGIAWIFTEEKWFDNLPILSFGKLRGSYGVTGNDQIGDYQFLDSWQAGSQTYEGTSTLRPSALANQNYSWEENKKLEAAIDLGFFKDRLLISANYYRNRSSNQLVAYRLPYTTGFASIIRNFPALVQNDGWEFTVTADIFKGSKFNWSTSINSTLPSNKLVDFPNIETSTYASIYKVGESLNSLYNYHFEKIAPSTGLYKLTDVDGNGFYDVKDQIINGNLDPKFYGGINNTFTYKGIELSVFFDYKQQTGKNFLYTIYNLSQTPGTLFNQPALVVDRWQNANSIAQYEKYQAVPGSTVSNVKNSDRAYSDASFIRLRNIQINYVLPQKMTSKLGVSSARVYMQGQNLFTWSKLDGLDPETQNLYSLPPLKVYTIGLQLNL